MWIVSFALSIALSADWFKSCEPPTGFPSPIQVAPYEIDGMEEKRMEFRPEPYTVTEIAFSPDGSVFLVVKDKNGKYGFAPSRLAKADSAIESARTNCKALASPRMDELWANFMRTLQRN
ncbi:MAG: hypothetical protein C5B49_11140 [Bdellovibrio sp.]|nr:MAG: hypothetical protein C5B49_11140 [Bdellovibrio sp.]